jgi:hypothetical protein
LRFYYSVSTNEALLIVNTSRTATKQQLNVALLRQQQRMRDCSLLDKANLL